MKKLFKGFLLFICVAAVSVSFASCGYKDAGFTEKTTRSDSVEQTEQTVTASGKYYYNKLSDREKRAYDKILSKIYTMPEEELYIPNIDSGELDTAYNALLKDNPDVFFTGRQVHHREFALGLLCRFEYIFSAEEYETCKAELDAVCDEVIASLSDPDDEWQTELEIHDYIIENCRYKIVENEHIYSSAYGALVNGEAACEGYSKAIQLLLDRAGIENYVICGQATNNNGSGSHMWNIVKINGDFYHLDATWNDPTDNESENHRYFNVTDEMISQTHSDFSEDFECTATAENYYVRMGTSFGKYNSTHKKEMISVVAREVNAGNGEVEFCFVSEADAINAYDALVSGDMTDYQSVSSETGVDFGEVNPTYKILSNLNLVQIYWNMPTEGTDTNG